jgi:IS30 family transposase
MLGRAPSTLSREVARNGRRSVYRAAVADKQAWHRTRRPQHCRLSTHPALRRIVAHKLAQQWSPQQVSDWLRCTFPSDADMQVSPETIYRSLFVQSRGVLRRCLLKHLRRQHSFRHARAGARLHPRQGQILDAVSIRERPAEVRDRAVPGHWEGDLILGLGSSAIGTLVERTTRFTMLLHLPRMTGHGKKARVKNGPALAGHGAEAVCHAITRTITTLPEQLRRSLTWDQGAEMAQHARLKIDAGLQVYFCDPQSPWQRATNENTNGLLRQYFPKGTDLSGHSADEIAAVAAALNTRPRKTLKWKTPAEALDELLRSANKPVATTA